MTALDRNRLGIYLNDHLAGATGGVELARRAAGGSTRYQHELRSIAAEIVADRLALKQIMQTLGVPTRSYKQYGTWLAEKIGRFKPNGRLIGRAPLTDVVELEALRIAVEGKAAGWRLLRRLAEHDARIDRDLLDRLLDRAERQAEELERLRLSAAADTLTTRSSR
jgi:hypothetical protein